MAEDQNITQVRQRNPFERTILEMLWTMEWVVAVRFQETGTARPVRAITIQTTIAAFLLIARLACRVFWRDFLVQKMGQIQRFVVQELPQIIVLALRTNIETAFLSMNDAEIPMSFARDAIVDNNERYGINVTIFRSESFNWRGRSALTLRGALLLAVSRSFNLFRL